MTELSPMLWCTINLKGLWIKDKTQNCILDEMR